MLLVVGLMDEHGLDATSESSDRMLVAIADHLHEHCTCDRPGSGACDACEVRHGLRAVREELLAWRAQGRRLAQRREDALANAHAQVQRRRSNCGVCTGLAGLTATTEGVT